MLMTMMGEHEDDRLNLVLPTSASASASSSPMSPGDFGGSDTASVGSSSVEFSSMMNAFADHDAMVQANASVWGVGAVGDYDSFIVSGSGSGSSSDSGDDTMSASSDHTGSVSSPMVTDTSSSLSSSSLPNGMYFDSWLERAAPPATDMVGSLDSDVHMAPVGAAIMQQLAQQSEQQQREQQQQEPQQQQEQQQQQQQQQRQQQPKQQPAKKMVVKPETNKKRKELATAPTHTTTKKRARRNGSSSKRSYTKTSTTTTTATTSNSTANGKPKGKQQRNKESARAYRERKKQYVANLERENKELHEDVYELRKQNSEHQATIRRQAARIAELEQQLSMHQTMPGATKGRALFALFSVFLLTAPFWADLNPLPSNAVVDVSSEPQHQHLQHRAEQPYFMMDGGVVDHAVKGRRGRQLMSFDEDKASSCDYGADSEIALVVGDVISELVDDVARANATTTTTATATDHERHQHDAVAAAMGSLAISASA
eukprot:TRINITY_DN67928_c5_g12_i2.p1 TRINITY_DN67928_c5_g12~~TRINITY_DN67928_c5_g12_i2.p1  ORF type:complete len:486 (-),score=272.08 TRINITY_DN67928_c5_g12_i2:495-1952(-)